MKDQKRDSVDQGGSGNGRTMELQNEMKKIMRKRNEEQGSRRVDVEEVQSRGTTFVVDEM